MKIKPIAFRPTETANQNIKDYRKANPKLTKTEAINALIENTSLKASPVVLASIQNLEADETALLVRCPLRKIPLPLEDPTIYWKPPVPKATCQICSTLPTCESWNERSPTRSQASAPR